LGVARKSCLKRNKSSEINDANKTFFGDHPKASIGSHRLLADDVPLGFNQLDSPPRSERSS
jgi:hypothetical protein